MEEQYEGKEFVGTLKGNSQTGPINWEFNPATAHQFTQQIPTFTGAPVYFTDKHAASMTLRDHFAGLAMQGMISREGGGLPLAPDFIAVKSYEYAEAMLVAREEKL